MSSTTSLIHGAFSKSHREYIGAWFSLWPNTAPRFIPSGNVKYGMDNFHSYVGLPKGNVDDNLNENQFIMKWWESSIVPCASLFPSIWNTRQPLNFGRWTGSELKSSIEWTRRCFLWALRKGMGKVKTQDPWNKMMTDDIHKISHAPEAREDVMTELSKITSENQGIPGFETAARWWDGIFSPKFWGWREFILAQFQSEGVRCIDLQE